MRTTARWTGQDVSGNVVPFGDEYPYDLSVRLVRVWIGSGRGPRCARDEDEVRTERGASACVVDELVVSNAGSIRTNHDQWLPGSRAVDVQIADLRVAHSEAVHAELSSLSDEERVRRLQEAERVHQAAADLRIVLGPDATATPFTDCIWLCHWMGSTVLTLLRPLCRRRPVSNAARSDRP